MNKTDLSLKLCGVTLKNPVITASGTCGFGKEYEPYYTPESLGAIAVKGLTLKPRLGNPPPRVAETPSGMLNSIGLQNPGVEAFLKTELPVLKARNATVIANIAGNTIEDYCEMAEILSESNVDFVEMNISCPNVKEGGVAFGTDEKMVERITKEVRTHCKKPLIVKLSPNVTDIRKTALAAESAGADALSLINTVTGMKIDIKTKKPLLYNKTGGLSGPCIRPIAVRMVWQVKSVSKLPIIGMGGIATGEDAIEFILAGADAVSIGAASFANPLAPMQILDFIEEYLIENKMTLNELVGLALK